MPRFEPANYAANLQLLDGGFGALAAEAGCTPAQLALAWVLSRGEHVVAIPGTTSLAHLEEDLGAAGVTLGRPLGAPVTDEEVWGYLLARKNSVTATYCNVTAENVPDKDIESPHSAPVWFTYSRSLLYDED